MKRSVLIVPVIILTMIVLLACSASPLTTRISRGIAAAAQAALPSSTPTIGAVAVVQPTDTLQSPNSLPTLAVSSATSTPATLATLVPAAVIPAASQQQIQGSSGDINAYQNTIEAVYLKVNPSVVSIQVVEKASAGSSNGGR